MPSPLVSKWFPKPFPLCALSHDTSAAAKELREIVEPIGDEGAAMTDKEHFRLLAEILMDRKIDSESVREPRGNAGNKP
jgi:hypothetical protein